MYNRNFWCVLGAYWLGSVQAWLPNFGVARNLLIAVVVGIALIKLVGLLDKQNKPA